jgi:class 3 adenylate cyclase
MGSWHVTRFAERQERADRGPKSGILVKMRYGDMQIEELSARIGEPLQRLREWQSLGLIGSRTASVFSAEDVERVRLVQFGIRRGFAAEAIAEADRKFGGLLNNQIELLFPHGVGYRHPLPEAAATAGLAVEQVRRLAEAAGIGEDVLQEDVEMLRLAKHAYDVGFPEEALLELVRVHIDSLGRVAEADVRLFHFYIHERLRAAGVSGPELVDATSAASAQLRPMIEPLMIYAHRKGMAKALREDMLMHLAEAAGAPAAGPTPAQLRLAVVFTDLSSFTPMTQSMGDAAAAQVIERFSGLVREAAARWEGRVVERIGDAFMTVFSESQAAVGCALDIEMRSAAQPQFPAVRSGVHWGEVLYREGGYVGSNVNIAARIATEAIRHQTLVTAAVQQEALDLEGVDFVPLGKRRLKGLADELELFEVRRRRAEATAKAIDPVCAMEMNPEGVAARLSLDGRDRAFCSEHCLRMFVATPEKYAR